MPSPGELPDPGIGLGSPTLQMDSLPVELPGKPSHSYIHTYICNIHREFERTPGDSVGRGAWHASVHEVAKSRTRLSN